MTADVHETVSKWPHQYTKGTMSCLATMYPKDEIFCVVEIHLQLNKFKTVYITNTYFFLFDIPMTAAARELCFDLDISRQATIHSNT